MLESFGRSKFFNFVALKFIIKKKLKIPKISDNKGQKYAKLQQVKI